MAPKLDFVPGGWSGEDLSNEQEWVMTWSETELDGLDQALEECAGRQLYWYELDKHDFLLTDPLKEKLEQMALALEEGRGLVKVEGLPIGRYNDQEIRLLWFGLALNLGRPLFQDSRGQLMREIRDEGGDLGARHGRIVGEESDGEFLSSKARTYGAGALRFHTDRSDVVGLLCLGQAKSGGLSRIASTIAVHNALLERRPDLLALLYQPITRSRLGEEEGGERTTYDLPVFGQRDGKLTSHFSRTYIEAADLASSGRTMTEAKWEAIDALAQAADDLSYSMRLQPGDMQFLNSHVTYHARTPFEDAPAEGLVRRLLRVWLAMPNSRALPADHQVLWGQTDAGTLRGGIGQKPLDETSV